MKRFFTIALAVASMGILAAGTASAAHVAVSTYNAGEPANGIGDSRHNLGNLGIHLTSLPNSAASGINGTSEICVFCHTPHHSNTSLSNVPIWNRTNSSAATYVAYGATLGGSTVGAPGSTTLACLSCHDGVTTFDNLANRPGKGTGALGAGFNMWEVNANGVTVGIVSNKMTSSRLNIGTSLSNDHPVSVAYASDGRASLRPTSTVISSVDVAAGLASSAATFDGGNLTKNLWAVKGYINAGATINDLLRGGNVECSSCHDPHFNNKSYNEIDTTYTNVTVLDLDEESNGLFLRRVGGNSGSGLCRTCHNK